MTRNEVIETIRTWIHTADDEYDIEEQGRVYGLMEALELIKQIEPEQKIGHWIKTISENGITSAVRCSECGFEDNRYMLFRYCPNCIAKMVEPQESEIVE